MDRRENSKEEREIRVTSVRVRRRNNRERERGTVERAIEHNIGRNG